MEKFNNRIRREREAPQDTLTKSRTSNATFSPDPKRHFSLLNDHLEKNNRTEFERRRRDSIARKKQSGRDNKGANELRKTAPAIGSEEIVPRPLPESRHVRPVHHSNSLSSLTGRKALVI